MKKVIKNGIVASLFSLSIFAQEIDISNGWKFKTGDDLKWADSKLDEKDWKGIETNRSYEFQGYDKYDG